MDKIIIEVGVQLYGYTFRISPRTRAKLERESPNLPPPTSLFVGFDTRSDFEKIHGSMWQQIVSILTGLSEDKLKKLGGYDFVDPLTNQVIHRSAKDKLAGAHV